MILYMYDLCSLYMNNVGWGGGWSDTHTEEIIIKSLFSEDYILSTGTYLTYGPLNIKITLNIYTNYVHLYKETIGINV